MPQHNDLSRFLVALEQDSTVIAVIEMSQSSWFVAGIVPGVGRHPLKKLEPDEEGVLRLLQRWQEEATQAERTITRVAVAFEAAVVHGSVIELKMALERFQPFTPGVNEA